MQRVIRPYLLTNQIDKALIILDQAKQHITEELKSSFAAVNCYIVFIFGKADGFKKFFYLCLEKFEILNGIFN